MARKKEASIKRVWCSVCITKTPPVIRQADFMMPVRKAHYDLLPNSATIDRRLAGICKECLKNENDFKKNNAHIVDVDNEYLVSKCV